MNEDAAAIAALNQTVRQLVAVLGEIHADLDRLGYPPKEERRGTGESQGS